MKKQRGWTLVDMLIKILFLAILVILSVKLVVNYQNKNTESSNLDVSQSSYIKE